MRLRKSADRDDTVLGAERQTREPALKWPKRPEAAWEVEKVACRQRVEMGDPQSAASLPGRDLDGTPVKRDVSHHYVSAGIEGIVLE